MGTTLGKDAYRQLIQEDIDWLKQQPRTLEREHILAVLNCAVSYEYSPCVCGVSRYDRRTLGG